MREARNNGVSQRTDDELPQVRESSPRVDRRKFLGQAGAAAAAVSGALANPSLAFGQSINSNDSGSLAPASGNNRRVLQSFQTRVTAAAQEARIRVPRTQRTAMKRGIRTSPELIPKGYYKPGMGAST